MFGGGGDVAADRGEAFGSVEAAELAGDLGLELHHADVAFGLVVVERDVEVGREREEPVAVLNERGGEVVAVAFVGVPGSPGGRVGVRGVCLGAELVPSFPGPSPLVGRQAGLVGVLRGVDPVVRVGEQVDERVGLWFLGVYTPDAGQVADEVRVAQGVVAVVGEVRGVAVMDRDAPVGGEGPGCDRGVSSGLRCPQQGQQRGGTDMDPRFALAVTDRGLIDVDHRRLAEADADRGEKPDKCRGGFGEPVVQCPDRDPHPEHLSERFGATFLGDVLAAQQVDRVRLDVGPCDHSRSAACLRGRGITRRWPRRVGRITLHEPLQHRDLLHQHGHQRFELNDPRGLCRVHRLELSDPFRGDVHSRGLPASARYVVDNRAVRATGA